LHRVCQIRTRFFYKYQTYQPWLIDNAFDYCAFRRGAKNAVMEMMIGLISKYSNNTHPCPFNPPELFVAKDLILDGDYLPDVIPTGEYRLDMEWFKDEKQTIRYALIETYFTARSLSIFDIKMG